MTKNGGGTGKLGKLKCMIKRWHAASSQRAGARPAGVAAVADAPRVEAAAAAAAAADDEAPFGLHPVYVGKSRRRYLVGSHLVDHPLFRVLVQRSGGTSAEGDGGAAATTLAGCEVVLFEHLLWMLENADPQSESLDELVEFYAC